MSEDDFDEYKLSEEDLAVLQAFEAMEDWSPAPIRANTSQSSDSAFITSLPRFTYSNDGEMLMIFIAEAEEDIVSMRQILEHLMQDDHINLAHFVGLQRLGHKLHGTAGSVDFPVMSTIASQVEMIAEQVTEQKIYPAVGIYALFQTITILESYLREIIFQGKEPESTALLAMLDITYKNMSIDLQLASKRKTICTNVASCPGSIADAINPVDHPSQVRHYTHSVTLSSTWERKEDAGKPNPLVKPIRVLVADDAVYLRHLLRQTLQNANYMVIEARDGMEAIEKLQESIPEVCVLDVEMPILNGFDVLNIVHQTPALKSMKVIMLTSRSSEEHQLYAMELGAHAYLTKPCSQETLLTTIQELLTSH